MRLRDVIDSYRYTVDDTQGDDETGKVLVASVNDSVVSVAETMLRKGVAHVIVMDGESRVGMVPLPGILSAALEILKDELMTLHRYIEDLHAARMD